VLVRAWQDWYRCPIRLRPAGSRRNFYRCRSQHQAVARQGSGTSEDANSRIASVRKASQADHKTVRSVGSEPHSRSWLMGHLVGHIDATICPFAPTCSAATAQHIPWQGPFLRLSQRADRAPGRHGWGMTVNGASFAFPLAWAEVGSLNRHRPFSLGGGNGSKCPKGYLCRGPEDLSRRWGKQSFDHAPTCPLTTKPLPKQISGVGPSSTTRMHSCCRLCDCRSVSTRQSNCEFSELADLAIDTDRAAVLLGDDVIGDR
jgi:hypothetical protein